MAKLIAPMRLPVKLEYAFQVMAQLAITEPLGAVRRIDDLASAEQISSNYLVQILNELRSAGLVESRRGKNGGYLLARAPSEITLADIAQAIEGQHLLETSTGTGGESSELTIAFWKQADECLRNLLANTSLDALVPTIDSADWVI